MKFSILLVLFALCAPLSSQAGQITLTPTSPEAVALGLINDAASDSWAELGNVQQLDFTRLQCDLAAARCTLTYQVKLEGARARTGACELTAISGYDTLLEIVKYGFLLKAGVTAQIDACMSTALL